MARVQIETYLGPTKSNPKPYASSHLYCNTKLTVCPSLRISSPRIEDNNNISGVGAKGFDFFHFNERLHKLEQLAQNTSKNAIDKEQKLNETIFQLQLLKEQLLLNQKSDEMVSNILCPNL